MNESQYYLKLRWCPSFLGFCIQEFQPSVFQRLERSARKNKYLQDTKGKSVEINSTVDIQNPNVQILYVLKNVPFPNSSVFGHWTAPKLEGLKPNASLDHFICIKNFLKLVRRPKTKWNGSDFGQSEIWTQKSLVFETKRSVFGCLL